MNTDNVRTKTEAREKLIAGFNKVADAVALTLGAAGSNAVLQADALPGHRITNDGVSIAQAIHLDNPYENMGANIAKEVASRADKESGDGTTTSLVLARAILQEGVKVDAHPMEIMRSLNECLPIINKSIDDQTKQITVDEVGKVATISAEDEELGATLQKVYQEVGKDGIVELDNSNLPETFYEIIEGVRFRGAGYLGAYSSTEPGRAVYINPKILISKEKITTVNQIETIVKLCTMDGVNELVIYCEDMDMAVASRLALTHLQGGFKTLVIKAPTLWKDWFYADLAKITGATPVSTAEGKTFKTLQLSDLGTCDKIITTKDETRVLGIKDIKDYVQGIKDSDDENKQMHLSWLQTKVAVLKIGANSDSELSYKKLKAIDAISACHYALSGGVVAGGGIALLNAVKEMPDTIGGEILKGALVAPVKQIIANAGSQRGFGETRGITEGFNAKTGEVIDMFEANIIDPSIITKNAIKVAISVAGSLLTTQIAVKLNKP